MNGLDGIHFISDDENNYGVAYVQLPTKKDYDLARKFDRKKLDERYIEGESFYSVVYLWWFWCWIFFRYILLKGIFNINYFFTYNEITNEHSRAFHNIYNIWSVDYFFNSSYIRAL